MVLRVLALVKFGWVWSAATLGSDEAGALAGVAGAAVINEGKRAGVSSSRLPNFFIAPTASAAVPFVQRPYP